MATVRKVTLKSSDDELFDVTEAVAFESQTIKIMVEGTGTANAIPLPGTGTANAIPLPNVSSKILSKVIEYCTYHVQAQKTADERSTISEDEIKNWDQEIVKVDEATLCDLLLAANYLKIKDLLDLTCQTIADMMKAKTHEEVR